MSQLEAADAFDLALWALNHPDAGDVLEEEDQRNYQNLLKAYKSNAREREKSGTDNETA